MNKKNIKLAIVNESGASIYSATKSAQSEYPDVSINNLSAISIARRLQDPSAELVKIDPKTLGIGQYQHDINAKKLSEALSRTTKDTINQIGVNVNTASAVQLQFVAGLTTKTANAVVARRQSGGVFVNRRQIKAISGISDKVYDQCIGFLKIEAGEEPLDAYLIHPMHYGIARKVLEVTTAEEREANYSNIEWLKAVSEKCEAANDNVKYIVEALSFKEIRDKIGLDLFEGASSDAFEVGASCHGIIRSVTTFGMFIDTGHHIDGLLHVSKIDSKRRVDLKEFTPGQKIDVVIDSIVDKPDGTGKKVSLVTKLYFEQTNKVV